MRFFKGKPLELLAPAGNFEIFKEVVQTKCDAIYFGGQSLNMRMIRKGFNFTDEEIIKAIELAHKNDKRVYITVNNLVDFDEIETAKLFLTFLDQVKPDAIIVQDFAIIELIRSLNLSLEVHASVMMNVHNVPMINVLKEHSITRVVLSRESTLDDVKWIKSQTDIEIEYFTHGDMCTAHGAQCYYSSILFGMSGNRGKCLKPCRWWFSKTPSGEKEYPMAAKDLCLYAYLPEMIHSGVTSFKLEGRMRDAEFITKLIHYYGDAMDRFIEDPVGYDRYKDLQNLEASRKRDFSTAYAFGKPGVTNINTRYEGTGKFYSTGKMFSTPTSEKTITDAQVEHLKKQFSTSSLKHQIPKLSIRVNNLAQAKTALQEGVDRLYISGDIFLPDPPISIEDIKALKLSANNAELYIATPRMMNALQIDHYTAWLSKLSPYIDGIMVGNLGALNVFKTLGLPIVGDYSLNIYNPLAADFYKRNGLCQFMPSVELNAKDLKALLTSNHEIELTVLGRIVTMYFEHDFHKAFEASDDHKLTLYNEAGTYDYYKDQNQRSHLLSQYPISLLPVLNELCSYESVKLLRIEAQTLSKDEIKSYIKKLKSSLMTPDAGNHYDMNDNFQFTFGSLIF